MPEVGHFIIAFSILIPVFYLTDSKFNKKVAVIFVLCNWIGPDHAQIFGKLFNLEDLIGLDFHWFIPFLLWAIPLAYFYSYFSRFSVKKTEHFYTIADDGKRDVNWKNAYLLCISGGLLHTIADAFFRHNMYDSTIKFLNEWIEPQLGELNQLAAFGIDVGVLHVVLTYFIAIIVVFTAMYLLDKDFKKVMLFTTIYFIAAFFITLFFVGEEYDTAVIILSVTFIIIPLMLLFYVDKNVRNKPTIVNESPRLNTDLSLKIIGITTLLLSVLLLIGGILITAKPSILDSLEIGEEFILALGILLSIVGGVLLFGSIGIFKRIKLCRTIIMVATCAMLLLVYPLFILFYLAQDDVKAQFTRKE